MPVTITAFRREYRFLSNFYLTPVLHNGLLYPSSENAYQAAKCIDPAEAQQFLNPGLSPWEAKQEGKRVKPIPGLDAKKVDLMRGVLASKFSQGSEMARLLLDTDDAILIESNWWNDTFWGVSEQTGNGKNILGILLMERRDELRCMEPLP